MMITMAITVAVSVVNGPYINTIVDDDGAAFTIDADSSLLLDKLSASFSVETNKTRIMLLLLLSRMLLRLLPM